MTATPSDAARPPLQPWRELLRFLPDIGRLFLALGRDARVPWQAKAVALATAAYVISPIDIIPDFLPGVGQADDIYVLTRGLRYLFKQAGYEVVEDLWTGTDEGFALLLVVTGIER